MAETPIFNLRLGPILARKLDVYAREKGFLNRASAIRSLLQQGLELHAAEKYAGENKAPKGGERRGKRK